MKTKQIFATLFIAALVSVSSIFIYSKFDKTQIVEVPVLAEQPVRYASYSAAPAAEDIDFTIAAQNTVHGVVHVKTQFTQEEYYNPLYDFFFGGKGQRIPIRAPNCNRFGGYYLGRWIYYHQQPCDKQSRPD